MSDVYVRRDLDHQIVFQGNLRDSVAEARRLAKNGGSFTVADQTPNGDEVIFNRYPDVDLQWDEWVRQGLVARATSPQPGRTTSEERADG